jgi:glycosyltransferase involved in cell wall biosynthesis
LLIPFSSNDPSRTANFKWLVKYWKHELPDAEIIIGRSRSRIFCKGEALNHAVRKSKGKVLVILDADAYLPGKVIEDCANLILENLDNHLWYVPYRNLYRLTEAITRYILCTDPEDPYRPPSPPPPEYVENLGHHSSYGHRYGAMIMMFPREAYDLLGCFDERFKGWGGEDVALLRALDTLYGKHKTTKNDVLHLWHPIIGHNYKTRRWDGQTSAGDNFRLASEYNKAIISPARMREIVDEGCKHCHKFL